MRNENSEYNQPMNFDEDNLLKEIDKVIPIGVADSVDVDIREDVLANGDA